MSFALLHDVTIHYKFYAGGNGVPLVFLNSLGSDMRIWDGVVAEFVGGRAVVCMDKRGHGLSDCPAAPYGMEELTDDVVGVLDHLGIEAAVIIGDSVGGMMALDFGMRYGGRTAGLVLCDTAAKIGTREYWDERVENLRKGGIEPIADGVLERWFSPQFIEGEPAAYNGYRNMLTRTPLEGYIGVCEAIRDADLRGGAAEMETPTLVLCGAEDRATMPEVVRGLAELLPNGRFELIEGAGHIPSIERPAAVVEAIGGYLVELGR